MGDLYVLSMNCRGLAEPTKRRGCFKWLREKKVDIAMLQDTHWSPELNNYISSEWGFRAFFSSYKSNSRGVAILLDNTFEFEITNQINDINGNFLILELTLPGILSLIIGNVYGPNSDSPNFYTKLNNILNDLENPNMIIAGDWNLTLNQEWTISTI